MKFLINEEFLPKVEKKLMSIKRKCETLGNDFLYEIGEPVYREYGEKENKEIVKFITINVEGIAEINGYEIVGLIEPYGNGNVIKPMKEGAIIPERFRHTDCTCEHCNIKRARSQLLIVHNIENDTYKQVGKSCLKLYSGGLNAAAVASWYNELKELEESDGFIGSGCKYYRSIEEILEYTIPIINKIGYFNSDSRLPTKYLVSIMMQRKMKSERVRELNKEMAINNISVEFDKTDFEVTDTLESHVKEIINYYKSLEDKSDFVHNIKLFLQDEYVEVKNTGFIVYLPEGYRRAKEREAERREREEREKKVRNNVHFGTEKQRYKGVEYTGVYYISCYLTEFGETYIYRIALKSGEFITWKTQKWLCNDKGEILVKENGTVDFTVKEHSYYKNVAQTIVTRVTFK